jgi:hypothetical protein
MDLSIESNNESNNESSNESSNGSSKGSSVLYNKLSKKMKEKYTCDYCKQVYLNDKKYYDHVNKHQNLFSFQCHFDLCYKMFNTESTLRSHLYSIHHYKFKDN